MKRAAFRLLPIVGLLLWQFAAAATTAASPSAQVVHHASSPFYDDIFVVDENGTRSLRFRSAGDDAQSLIRPGHPEQLPMPYLRSAAVGLAMPEQVERALMIGLGGGAFANYIQVRLPDAYTDAVEIDPVVADIAREYFAVTEGEQLTVHVRDAVDFVREKRDP